jgi:hypothetical protein
LFPQTLDGLLSKATSTLDTLRNTVVKSAAAGKAQIDVQLAKRQRDKAFAALGAVAVAEANRGAALPPACDDLLETARAMHNAYEAAVASSGKPHVVATADDVGYNDEDDVEDEDEDEDG